MANFVVRALKPNDFDAIKAINAATYGGHDYIQAQFPGWMQRHGSDLWTFAMEDETGEVAALEVLTLEDQGTTGWLDALRVHPRARGKGMAVALEQEVCRYAREELKLARVRLSTTRDNTASRKIAQYCGLETHRIWGYCQPEGSLGEYVDKLVECKVDDAVSPTIEPFSGTAADLHVILSSLHVDTLLQHWKVYDLSMPKLETLLTSAVHQPPQLGRDRDGKVTSVSWAAWAKNQKGIAAFITVYHSGDFECLRAHTVHELTRAKEHGASLTMLFFDDKCESDLFRLGLTNRTAAPLDGEDPLGRRVISFENSFDRAGSPPKRQKAS